MIIVSALDNSGELYAADLVTELRKIYPTQEFVGIGGRELARAGCRLVHDISDSSAMLAGIVGALKWAVPAYRKLVAIMKSGSVDAVILVDSPTFNLPLARAAKRRGIKTFYYIAPQVWAWGEFRIRKIQKRVDRLAVILPFEENYFRRFGLNVDFVGHPFIDRIKDAPLNPELAARFDAIQTPRILLMPGSRRHVVRELLAAQLRVVETVRSRLGPVTVSVAAWQGALETIIELAGKNGYTAWMAEREGISSESKNLNLFTTDRPTLIEKSDLVLAASGTGTLEVAWHGRPMIVMYNASRIGYQLVARWLIKTRFLSLINILAQRELVPEFMPYIRDENKVAAEALKLLGDKTCAQKQGREAQTIVRALALSYPARRVAQSFDQLLTPSH